MFYGIGSSETLFSHWSLPFRTLSLSVPDPITVLRAELDSRGDGIVLKFKDPEDNGGSVVTGYSVYAKYSDDNLKKSWHALSTHMLPQNRNGITKTADVISIVVRNVVLAAEIRLRVSCHNSLGEGPLSFKTTEPLKLLKPSMPSKDGGLLLDSERELVVSPPCSSQGGRSFEVWSSRHLSHSWSISTESVFIEEAVKIQHPAFSDFSNTCLRPATTPAGSIAIIPRSEEPIVAMALRLQVKHI